MKREEFKIIVKAMKAVYADPKFIPDKDAFDVWYALLGDLSYELCETAVQKHMISNKYPPTIAEIRENALGFITPESSDLTDLAAWGLVRKAICNSGYHAEEEFAKLPEACQKAVGSPANLREMAMLDTKQVETVEQSHFIRSFNAVKKRMEMDALMPVHIAKRIGQMRESQMLLSTVSGTV